MTIRLLGGTHVLAAISLQRTGLTRWPERGPGSMVRPAHGGTELCALDCSARCQKFPETPAQSRQYLLVALEPAFRLRSDASEQHNCGAR